MGGRSLAPRPADVGNVDSARLRLTLLALAALLYSAITSVFIEFEHPGLGIGHLYYIPIVLVAFATGPVRGGAAGVLAALLYNVSIFINPHLPSTIELAELFVDTEKLVVFGDAVGTGGCASLDLTRVGGDGKVGDRAVFSFSAAV